MPNGNKPLTPDEARDKAAESVELAERVENTRHRIMLEHIAETWERIAREMERKP